MGRPRKYRKDLPECVYFKCGSYYFVVNNKWEKLSSDYQEAMVAWAAKVGQPTHALATVGELLDRYLREVVPRKAERTQTDNRQEIRFLRTFFNKMAIRDVRPEHLVEYVGARKAKTRANREIALMSHAFNKAILWGLCSTNPCSVAGIRNREKARDRYVTDEEVEQFKKECPTWLKHYVDLKLQLGLRRGDLLNLQWKDVGPETLIVLTGKTKTKIAFALTPEVKATLSHLSKSSDYLFPMSSGKPYNSNAFNAFWQRMMERYVLKGHERFHEHDLRGKVATDIGDVNSAKALLGHKSIKMTESYIKARATDIVQPHTRSKKNGT